MAASIIETMQRRRSCRTYRKGTLDERSRALLEDEIARATRGPFGSDMRLSLVAANGDDAAALKGLGTYGMIKNPAGFIIGALRESPSCFEDFGYAMESIVLGATAAGLGTCWLGGTFKRSRFAERMALAEDEIIPAVVSFGAPADRRALESIVRSFAGSDHRQPWGALFKDGDFSAPLPEAAGPYRVPLEMVRIAPSASNRQPWRVVADRDGRAFHFYLQRSKGYKERNHAFFGIVDMQRIDMGIAMCHFELAATEAGLRGRWAIRDPGIAPLPVDCFYTASWTAE